MAKLGDAVNELAKRAGIEESDEALVALLQNEAIFKAEIPQPIYDKLLGGLMNESIAKVKLYPTIKAEVLNGHDDHVFRSAKELGFTDEELAEIKTEQNSGKKSEMLLKKQIDKFNAQITELKKGSGGGANAEKIEALTKEVNETKQKLVEVAAQREADILAERKASQDRERNYITMNAINEYIPRLDLPDTLTHQEKQSIAYARLDAKAKELKANIIVRDGQLALADDNGTDVLDAHNKKADFKSVAENAFSPIFKKGGNGGNTQSNQSQQRSNQTQDASIETQRAKLQAELDRQASLNHS